MRDPAGPLLAVHAHPDDETLSTGALLATWAASGRPVTVVTCTRGERGEVIDSAAQRTGAGHLEGDGPALAAYRERELTGALTALGVADHAFLDRVPDRPCPGGHAASGDRYEDSGMVWVAPGIAGAAPDAPPSAFARVPLDEAARRLAVVVRDRRPAVVVTYERGGGYGHPDHVRAHEMTVRALELAADPAAGVAGEPWRVPERWEAVIAASRLRDARRAVAAAPGARRLVDEQGLTLPDADEPLASVAIPDGRLDELARQGLLVTVGVAPVLGRVLAALRAHATQVQHPTALPAAGSPGGADARILGWYALSNGVLAPLTSAETYAVRPVDAPVGSGR